MNNYKIRHLVYFRYNMFCFLVKSNRGGHCIIEFCERFDKQLDSSRFKYNNFMTYHLM